MIAHGPTMLRTVVTVGGGSERVRRQAELLEAIARKVFLVGPAEATDLVAQSHPELVVVAEDVPAEEGIELVGRLRGAWPGLPIVVVSGRVEVDLAVKFVRAGAYDFVPAPLVGDRIERLVAAARASGTCSGERDRFFSEDCPPGLPAVGQGGAIVDALRTIRRVAESGCNPVLILGETGTGKELAARAVHMLRCPDEGKFVAVNCAALTSSLLESELFGHVRGAFTGADRDKTGLFELAGEGTIFLDEISEMPAHLQPKLLRVLQERTFRKVGGTADIRCRATIVASSNRDLTREAADGRFRRDLYYRLAVFPIAIPPLRSEGRRCDIPLLAEYFIETSTISRAERIRGLTPAAREKLLRHDWPGNVRELKNVIERAMILEQTDRITPSSIVLDGDAGRGASASPAEQVEPAGQFTLEAAEREFILRALRETGWQRTKAAALLGISRATLHDKLNRYDIQPPGSRRSARGNPGAPAGVGDCPQVTA